MSFLGKPYVWGGDDPLRGFDCSGFILELMQSTGIFPPNYDNNAQGLHDYFEKQGIPKTVGAFGRLVFFGGSVTKITHIAFCLDQYRFIDFGGGGSKTKTIGDAIAQNAYCRIRHIDHWRDDRVKILVPNYSSIGALGW